LEETGLTVENIKYVASCTIDDARYKNSPHSIKSAIFLSDYSGGEPSAQDDIDDVQWFHYSTLNGEQIVSEHRKVLDILKENTNIH